MIVPPLDRRTFIGLTAAAALISPLSSRDAKAKFDQPTTPRVAIHGGGWQGGERAVCRHMIPPALAAGISEASAECRTIKDSTADGLVHSTSRG
jgi:hypothetical protein